jgi:hypothetical protein
MEFSPLFPLNSPQWPVAPKPFIEKYYQIPTMSLQIVTFIVIGYYFPRLDIFLIPIFNRRYQNSLIYTPIPFFPHKSLPLKFYSYFEPSFSKHFRISIFKNLFANLFSKFQRSISIPLLQVSNPQFLYFICLISLHTSFRNFMELLSCTRFMFLNQHLQEMISDQFHILTFYIYNIHVLFIKIHTSFILFLLLNLKHFSNFMSDLYLGFT